MHNKYKPDRKKESEKKGKNRKRERQREGETSGAKRRFYIVSFSIKKSILDYFIVEISLKVKVNTILALYYNYIIAQKPTNNL